MMIHFEELWEKCENFHKENSDNNTHDEIIKELTMKIGLYSAIIQKPEIASKDIEQAKSRLMGEILLSLTELSLKDNINVFESLNTALQQHRIDYYSNKYTK